MRGPCHQNLLSGVVGVRSGDFARVMHVFATRSALGLADHRTYLLFDNSELDLT